MNANLTTPTHTYTHTYTHTHLKNANANSLAAARQSCACALSRHCESCKQSSWSRAMNSQENRPFLTASGVGTQSPTWTIALNLHPSKCHVPSHSWVDWWGWWEADGKTRWKNCHTHTHTHTHTRRPQRYL